MEFLFFQSMHWILYYVVLIAKNDNTTCNDNMGKNEEKCLEERLEWKMWNNQFFLVKISVYIIKCKLWLRFVVRVTKVMCFQESMNFD